MGLVYSEPACQAAYDGDVHHLYRLLREDANQLNVQDRHNGDTPLIAACRRGNLRVVRYLLDNGADVHLPNERTSLHYLSKRSFSLLDYLLISILMPILLLGYFLMLQKQRHSVSLMEAMLSSSVDVNAVDYKGNTALHYVCQRKSHRLIPLLLNRNADTNITNNEGETPLDIATRLKFKNIVQMLKKKQ
uniref:Ankyrin repeat domain 22 n=1 Tax=Gasterosteus aculeatus aculeatus TaxID=481459 RepID=G3P6F1_GASAC|nr:ankyrin repeat domain-containing protein 22 isoform X2 [Gasterosteus aculeatus aculeatus]